MDRNGSFHAMTRGIEFIVPWTHPVQNTNIISIIVLIPAHIRGIVA